MQSWKGEAEVASRDAVTAWGSPCRVGFGGKGAIHAPMLLWVPAVPEGEVVGNSSSAGTASEHLASQAKHSVPQSGSGCPALGLFSVCPRVQLPCA